MDLYAAVSAELSQRLTQRYSTSFSSASRLFTEDIKPHVYTIYALVRIADEIVDTYSGADQRQLLDELERECGHARRRGYSTNPIVHAFALTAEQYGIGPDLTAPFFASMRMDIGPAQPYSAARYDAYIHGSAEVVGLMCLKVFCAGDEAAYKRQADGARRLGAAYQKINFLRDMAADHSQLGRFYFADSTFADFDEKAKLAVTRDIRHDLAIAAPAIGRLPKGARTAVATSYRYYEMLLRKLERSPVSVIKARRIRLPAYRKALLLASQVARPR